MGDVDGAGDGDLLIDQRAYLDAEDVLEAEPCEACEAKGYDRAVECYRVLGLRDERAGA